MEDCNPNKIQYVQKSTQTLVSGPVCKVWPVFIASLEI